MSRSRRPLIVAIVVVALTIPLVPLPTAAGGSGGAIGAVVGPTTSGGGADAVTGPLGPPVGSPTPVANASTCAALQSAYEAYVGPRVPIDVAAAVQSPCYIGHDEAVVSFLSNATYSGARVAFTIDLPPAGTNPARAFTTLALSMGLSGVPCSLGGESYLAVELVPPYSALGSPASANWSVQAPVFDLVPPGSCDPQCQNDTAFFTLSGLAYCEDDVVISGTGALAPPGAGEFTPGDTLVVEIVGQVDGTNGTSVYVNDTSDPAASLAWTYSPAVTATHTALTPLANASSSGRAGWAAGADVGVRWTSCPLPGSAGSTACNSYDGPSVSAVGGPTIRSVGYWNASTLSYSTPYAWTTTTSSSGACSGRGAPCSDFTSWGGTGSYPVWSLHAFDGQSWWLLGGSAPDEVGTWGGSGAEFAAGEGMPAYLDPTTIYRVTNSSINGSVVLDARVADPNGVTAVTASAYFCFNASATPSAQTASASLAVSAYDTPQDGNWTATFTPGSYAGSLYYSVRAESAAGVWSTPVGGSVAVAGSPTCSFPSPSAPVLTLSNVTSIAGGYALHWSDASPGIADYVVGFNATAGGPPLLVDAGTATHLFAPLGLPSGAYYVWVNATTLDGQRSTSGAVLAPSPLVPLSVGVTTPVVPPIWVGGANVTLEATATGGTAPYTYTFSFSDGTPSRTIVGGTSVNLTHGFGSYIGNARVSVQLSDSDRVNATSSGLFVPCWGTPLGVPSSIAAGATEAEVSWGPPTSPGGPINGYTVYYTTNASEAPFLAATWPNNDSAAGRFLWNSTGSPVDIDLPVGGTVYAQVVAWNSWGEGLLPSGPSRLMATTAPLLLGPILASPGGPAPYTANVSAQVSNGTNDLFVQAVYTAGNMTVSAAVTPILGGAYLNATVTLPTPGPHLVVLHVTDRFYSIAIQLTTVYVSPGTGPSVVLTPPTTAGWVGWVGAPVDLIAGATGGIGPYTFAWQFGDGASGAGSNTTHLYSTSGTFTVGVVVTDTVTGGTTLATHPLLIYALPSVAITTRPGPNGSLSVDFGSLVRGGSGPAKVTWSFGDGSTRTGANVSHDYVSAGSYTVNATATDPSGRTASTQLTLTLTGAGNGGGGGGTFLGAGAPTLGVVLVGVTLLAAVFLGGLVYFWGRARRPPIVMAPEPSSEHDEGP